MKLPSAKKDDRKVKRTEARETSTAIIVSELKIVREVEVHQHKPAAAPRNYLPGPAMIDKGR
jgi:hypothetical protein